MQPPSGGCVLKQKVLFLPCNLKLGSRLRVAVCWNKNCQHGTHRAIKQPPSGGCVLKLILIHDPLSIISAAAFGWLCVETRFWKRKWYHFRAAASARLCVETISNLPMSLCGACSHLHAAVCWNEFSLFRVAIPKCSRLCAFCELCFRATSCTLRGILHFLSACALSVAFKRFKIVLLEFKVSVELNLKCER